MIGSICRSKSIIAAGRAACGAPLTETAHASAHERASAARNLWGIRNY